MKDQPEFKGWAKAVANEKHAILNLRYALRKARKCDCSQWSDKICWDDLVYMFNDIWCESQITLKLVEDEVHNGTRHL